MVKQVAARKQAVAVEKPALQNTVKLERVAAELEERVRQRYQKDLQKRRLTNPSLATPQWLYELPTVTSASRIVIEKGVDITPDIQREVQTYKLTLDNVNNILDRLKAAKINNERPHDYLAEMYKSDTHMTKIRRHLAEKDAYIKENMQNKKWQKRKKHTKGKKREPGPDKQKLIKKYKSKEQKQKNAKPKAPKMMKVKGKRKQKK